MCEVCIYQGRVLTSRAASFRANWTCLIAISRHSMIPIWRQLSDAKLPLLQLNVCSRQWIATLIPHYSDWKLCRISVNASRNGNKSSQRLLAAFSTISSSIWATRLETCHWPAPNWRCPITPMSIANWHPIRSWCIGPRPWIARPTMAWCVSTRHRWARYMIAMWETSLTW